MRIDYLKILIAYLLFLSFNNVRAQELETLSLEDAINLSLKNNPNITVSEADIDISEAAITKAKSAYYPQISSRIIVPFIGRESGFYLDQLIWDFGRTSNRVKSTKAILESSKYRKNQVRDNLIVNTTISYYTVLSDIHIVNSLNKRVIEEERRLEKTQMFFQSERATELEVARSETELAKIKLDLIKAEHNLEISKLNLKQITGIDEGVDVQLSDVSEYRKAVFDLNESVEQALNTRPELKALLAIEESNKANVEATKKEFYPTIFGRTAYRFEGEGAETPGFIAGVGIKFPIFEGFSRFGKVREARANLRKTKAEGEIAKADIVSEVKQYYLELEYAEENIIVTHMTRDSTEQTLLLAQERYKQQRASALEVAEAESLYEQSKTKYQQALYTYYINVAKLERATGGVHVSTD